MFKHVFVLIFLSTMLFAACQKDALSTTATTSDELQTQAASVENLSAGKVVSTAHWYGRYTGVSIIYDSTRDPGGDPDIMDINDAQLIKNGVAQLPPLANSYCFTNIMFDIPSNYNISGDSLTFTAIVKNPIAGGFYDYDVILQIIGNQHSAEIHFVADSSAKQYTEYFVGNTAFKNLPQLINYFGDFKTIKLILKKDQTAAYVNNVLIYKFNYAASNRIGKLMTINVAGRDYITVDNVTLTNSVTNKKILSESFNINGQSHTIFY